MKSEFKRILIERGFEEKIAEECSTLFTETSCDGVYSHGLNRFPRLVEYIDKGFIHKNAVPSKIEGMGSFERWNGNLGLGNVNAKICMSRAIELAKGIEKAVQEKTEINFIYDNDETIEEKVNRIASKLYGATKVEFSSKASSDIKKINELGLSNLPICMAKTQKSISDDPNLRGWPKDFTFKVREVEISSGAGFIVPISGEIMLMPGLPEIPSSENIDIDDDGNIIGLF